MFGFVSDWLRKPTPGIAADNAHSLVGYGKARRPRHVIVDHQDAVDFLEHLKEKSEANSDSVVDLTSGDTFPLHISVATGRLFFLKCRCCCVNRNTLSPKP